MLERFQAKWTPVRVKKMRQIKNLEPRFDSIETEKALVESRWKLPVPEDDGRLVVIVAHLGIAGG